MSHRPSDPEVLRNRALFRLFRDLFQRGRRYQRNSRMTPANVRRFQSWGVVLLAVFGCFLLALVSLRMPMVAFATFAHAFVMLFGGLSVVASCGTMLFNEQEPDILLHRPVTGRMILHAKVRVLLGSLCLNAVALSLALACRGVFLPEGAWYFAPAHLFSVCLGSLLTLGLLVLCFHLCLRWFGRERFNGLLASSQIVAVVVIVAGSQVAPRLLHGFDFAHWQPSAWLLALPPFWLGCLDTMLVAPRADAVLIAGALLAVGGTGLVAWLAFGLMAGSYEEAVDALQEHAKSGAPADGRRWTDRFADWMPVRVWLRDPVERAGFLLTLTQVTRVRGVKLRVFPRLVQFASYPLVLLFGGADGLVPIYVTLPGIFGMIGYMTADSLVYSEEHGGADLFRYAPLASPGALFFGAYKAVLLLTLLPVALLWGVVIVAVTHDPWQLVRMVPGLLFGLLAGLVPATTRSFLIFSEEEAGGLRMGRGCLMQFVPMLLGLVIGGISWAAWHYGWALSWLALVVAGYLAARWLLRGVIARRRADLE